MRGDNKKQQQERARRSSNIESIEISLLRFNRNLSDDRKVGLFTMNHAELQKLAIDVDRSQTSIKANSLIVAAIADSEEKRERNDGQRSDA